MKNMIKKKKWLCPLCVISTPPLYQFILIKTENNNKKIRTALSTYFDKQMTGCLIQFKISYYTINNIIVFIMCGNQQLV